mmetsp:Transcript_52834/g.57338  ORF Transcript_52834/g.57338 Transcript_52834/m.57338 type:complete len:304 (+) Transcript_52834:114-1025(+)
MKIVKSLPIFTIVFLVTRAFKANALLYSSGPLRRSSRPPRSLDVDCANGDNTNFSSSPRNNNYKKRQEHMDQVFRELQDEFGDGKRNSMNGEFNWVTMGLSQDPFKVIDKEATKKWTEKAFDLASEFNKDFAATSKERDTTDEYLQKSRDWVDRVYTDQENKATNDGQDSSSKQNNFLIASKRTSNNRDNLPTPTPDKQRVLPTETANSENRSNDEMFQVAVDLPGVVRAAVDITIDGDFLVIEATRPPGNDRQTTRKYIKRIAVVENEVDIDKMKASLNNGVLIVSAPKVKVTEIKRKIPIT